MWLRTKAPKAATLRSGCCGRAAVPPIPTAPMLVNNINGRTRGDTAARGINRLVSQSCGLCAQMPVHSLTRSLHHGSTSSGASNRIFRGRGTANCNRHARDGQAHPTPPYQKHRQNFPRASTFNMASESDDEGIDIFQEPADYYPPEKEATFASHRLLSGKELTVRLVGHNPLWVRPSLSPRFGSSASTVAFVTHLSRCSLFGC